MNNLVIPGFVSKTYEIFMSDEYKQCCDWSRDGTSIIINDILSFAKNVLPKYFKHSNFNSFVRQLNMYDFHKCLQDPSNGEFRHDFFKRGRDDLLINVKRKVHLKSAISKKRKHDSSDNESTNSEGTDTDFKRLVVYDSKKKSDYDDLIIRRLENLENKCQKLEIENIELKSIINDGRNRQQVFLNQMEVIFQTFYKTCSDANVPGLDNFAKSLLESSKLLNDTNKTSDIEWEDPDESLEWLEFNDVKSDSKPNESPNQLVKLNSVNSDSSNYFINLDTLNSESENYFSRLDSLNSDSANCFSRQTSLDWGMGIM